MQSLVVPDGVFKAYSQLRVKNTPISFNDADSLIESLDGVRRPFAIGDDSREIQPQILRVEVGCEIVADAVGLTGRNFHIISRGREVADYLRSCGERV